MLLRILLPYDFPPMFRRYRQRRGPYALAAPSVLPSVIRSVLLLGIVLLVLFFVGRWILGLFGGNDHLRRDATLLTVEDRGTVNVSLEGGLMQRAEDRLKLYPDDRVTTGSNSHAQLTMLDSTRIRLDANSDITLNENTRGEESSQTDVTLTRGAAWIKTPTLEIFSGSIVRTVRTDMLTLILPADAEVVLDVRALMVFSADGEGIEVAVKGSKQEFFIGEGQQW